MASSIEVVIPGPLKNSFSYRKPDEAIEIGDRVEVSFGRQILEGWVIGITENYTKEFTLKAIEKKITKHALFDASYLELVGWMSRYYWASLGDCLEAMLPKAKRERDITPESLAISDEDIRQPHKLHEGQEAALKTLKEASEGLFYLFGVTGSGKTEVFLHLCKEVLEKGKSIIYLVPEISLTNQVIEDLEDRFGTEIAVLHSKLTPSQKLGQWQRIKRNEAHIVVGARSAVFAPVQNLGLIIIDEEHETSYKSSNSPRYHARQVAMHRAQLTKAIVLMGSATPSLEAYALMKEGRITRIDLKTRVSGGAFPQIEIEKIPHDGILSPRLVAEMQKTLQEKKQVLLFLNRRGFSHFSFCPSCGSDVVCSHCSRPMTYHKSKDMLICHYCGRAHRPKDKCGSCGKPGMTYAGFGTEFVEETVKNLFPNYKIDRIDTDSVVKRTALDKKIQDFKNGETQILLGTQMIAKGLNFRSLGLVGVILGDGGFHIPDFRAAERSFGLLIQVAGRAGRYNADGKVLIQAAQPEHPIFDYVLKNDLIAFYEEELLARKSLDFPPFSRILRLVIRGKNESLVREATHQLFLDLSKATKAPFTLLGMSPCPIELMNGNHRHHILISLNAMKQAHEFFTKFFENIKIDKKLYLEIDLDPISIM